MCMCDAQKLMTSVLVRHTHVQASVFNIADVHLCKESLESQSFFFFTIYFYMPTKDAVAITRCCGLHLASDLTDRLVF